MSRRLVLAVLCAVAAATALVASTSSSTAQTGAPAPGSVLIDGAVGTPLTLTVADLRELPQHTAKVRYLAGTGSERHVFTGPLLADVLAKAVPSFDPAVKNAGLRHVVAATGSDGYVATVAWGEVDPAFAKRPVILATEQDGEPLDAAGPRLVVPGDMRGGRYVSGVVHLALVDATAGG